MAKFTDEQINEWIAGYEARRTRVLKTVEDLEKGGTRHYVGVGNEPLQDITDEWLQELKDEAAMWARLIAQYEKMKSEP